MDLDQISNWTLIPFMKGAEALGGDDVINNLSKHCIALAKHRNKTLYNKALIKH